MTSKERMVHDTAQDATLEGNLVVPHGAGGLVLFAHGSGSSRSARATATWRRCCSRLGLATLLMDLLTDDGRGDRRADRGAALRHRFPRRARGAGDRLAVARAGDGARCPSATSARAPEPRRRWWRRRRGPTAVGAVVSRGGRPDLAARALAGTCARRRC